MSVFLDKDMSLKYIFNLHLSLQENPFVENYQKYSTAPLFHYKNHSLPLKRSRLSALSLWIDNIIQQLSLFWIINGRSQSLILRKFKTDLSLTAFVAGITSEIFKRMITWEKYSREFTENVFSVSIMSLMDCSSWELLEKLTSSDLGWVVNV